MHIFPPQTVEIHFIPFLAYFKYQHERHSPVHQWHRTLNKFQIRRLWVQHSSDVMIRSAHFVHNKMHCHAKMCQPHCFGFSDHVSVGCMNVMNMLMINNERHQWIWAQLFRIYLKVCTWTKQKSTQLLPCHLSQSSWFHDFMLSALHLIFVCN